LVPDVAPELAGADPDQGNLEAALAEPSVLHALYTIGGFRASANIPPGDCDLQPSPGLVSDSCIFCRFSLYLLYSYFYIDVKRASKVNKYANIDFEKCDPMACNGSQGICAAARSCAHKLLEQEEAKESPMLLSIKMCVGCGTCVPACPLGAIEIKNG
jgi:NAD-dependent dihydropyrimidine dehydrogenase PreA subunit